MAPSVSGPGSSVRSAFACRDASTATATGASSASARKAGTGCSATNVRGFFCIKKDLS